MKQTFIEQLHADIDALVPILYLPMQDVDGLDDVIAELRDDQDIVEYHEGLGCVDFCDEAGRRADGARNVPRTRAG